MPELPEVETVRRGLAPVMEGARITRVIARRPDLRFPLPKHFEKRLTGAAVTALSRRGKYLTADLSTGETLIMHLGMTGRFTIIEQKERTAPGLFHHETAVGKADKHDHVVFEVSGAGGDAQIVYNDARRFGFMDLAETKTLNGSRHFSGMGPEPLGPAFTEDYLSARLKNSAAAIKAALLDQKIVAGLGNIYVCEALFRAGISPRRTGASVAGVRAVRLHPQIIRVLEEAISAGGSTLRDFAASDGALGYFQHGFQVYDREGAPCPVCETAIRRITQSGRSTFYCPQCQR